MEINYLKLANLDPLSFNDMFVFALHIYQPARPTRPRGGRVPAVVSRGCRHHGENVDEVERFVGSAKDEINIFSNYVRGKLICSL
jgi:hypothetical protein